MVVFLAMLLGAGTIYVGLMNGPPATPELTLQNLPLPHMARIILPGPGAMCRELMFDNYTGIFSNDRLRPCDEKPSQTAGQQGGSGLSSFRNGFNKR